MFASHAAYGLSIATFLITFTLAVDERWRKHVPAIVRQVFIQRVSKNIILPRLTICSKAVTVVSLARPSHL